MTRKHWTSASTSYPLITIYNKYIYDWMDRKDKTWEQITSKNLAADTMRLVSLAIYNEIGQLTFKKLDSKDSVNYMQTIGYLYNERGWLRQANAPRFNMVLSYNTDANKAYNGNIMYQFWGVPGNLSNHYTYTYDKLNRLTSGITSADNFQESGITYDTQGNLTALNRYSNGTEIDQLSYFYNSKNSLDSVRDANASNSGLVSGLTKYTYDGNGNMLSAANTLNGGQNKGITYNLLNLPNVVTIPTGTYTYTYDAAGNKLRMVKVIGGVTTNTDYIGGIQYSGAPTESIAFIQTEEGKAVPYGTNSYDYTYYLGDNLGNTRITFDTKYGRDSLLQKDDYYPFGLEINRSTSSPKNEYLYNKKELQEDFTEYDYGARFYDPVVVHWNTIDPLAEVSRRWSPYNYVEDNPIRFTDPDGMLHNFTSTGQAQQTGDEINSENANAWGQQKSQEAVDRALGKNTDNEPQQTPQSTQTNTTTVANPSGVSANVGASPGVGNVAPGNAETNNNQGGDDMKTFMSNFKEYVAIIASESSNSLDVARAMGSTMLNRTSVRPTSFFDPNWLKEISAGGDPHDFQGYGTHIYNEVKNMSIEQLTHPSGGYAARIQGALDALNNWGCVDYSHGSFFWNATAQQYKVNIGFNFRHVANGTYTITTAIGTTTFMKYTDPNKTWP